MTISDNFLEKQRHYRDVIKQIDTIENILFVFLETV